MKMLLSCAGWRSLEVSGSLMMSHEQLLKALEQMPTDELDQFVDRVVVLRAQRRAPHLSEKESELLLKINRGLPDNLLGV